MLIFGSANIAAFNGRNNPDHFFWGEIANQLGKGEQFRTFWNSSPEKHPTKKIGSISSRATNPS